MQNLEVALQNLKTDAYMPLKTNRVEDLPQNVDVLAYCLNGSFLFFVDRENYIVMQNQMALLPANAIHTCRALAEKPMVLLVFPIKASCHGQNLFTFFDMNRDALIVNMDEEKVLSVYNEMSAFTESDVPTLSKLKQNAGAMALCTYYVEARIEAEKKEVACKAVLSYIEQQIDKDISLDELSGILHYNPVRFSQKFKEETGVSPIRYVSLLRIKKAAKQLCFSQKSIREIAQESGFMNPYYFRNFFAKYIGLSPEDFRSRYRREPNNNEE